MASSAAPQVLHLDKPTPFSFPDPRILSAATLAAPRATKTAHKITEFAARTSTNDTSIHVSARKNATPVVEGRRRGRYTSEVSPTVLIAEGFRLYFFSREEPRMHVHVYDADGEAKFWLEPDIELAHNYGMSVRRVAAAGRLIRRHENEIRAAWHRHFER